MDAAIRRAVQALTLGSDAERHFDLAAKRIQEALLAVAIPDIDGFALGVHAEPARLVGGDYIDLYAVADSRELVFALGDASGKSLAAAMTALMLRYLVRGLVTAQGTNDLPHLLACINRVVSEDLSDGAFITFILGVLDAETGAMRVANAGHEPPLVLRAGASQIEAIAVHGIVLGVDHTSSYRDVRCELAPGDLAVIYTDGLTEATNKRGEMYTIERLSDEIVRRRDESAGELAQALFETIRDFADGELKDDATILVVKRVTGD
jgi:sigma-B regulation protein RsbU (phosphoserine phosphatase)